MPQKLAAVVALCAAVSAQSHTVAPVGYDSFEGRSFSGGLASLPQQRLQWAEGELKGNTRTLKGIGFRSKSKIQNLGRSFRRVTITLSDTNHEQMDAVFSRNAIGTPSRVFAGAVRFPAIHHRGPGVPPWDSRLAIAFQSSWVYRGTNGLLLDVTVEGGKMDNNAPWTRYLSDAPGSMVDDRGKQSWLGQPSCKDSNSHAAGTVGLESKVSGPLNYDPTKYYHLVIGAQCYWTAPRTTVANFFSLGGFPKGVTIPSLTCGKVYVDLAAPHVMVLKNTDQNGRSWGFSPFPVPMSWRPEIGGLRLYYQAAWPDTRTGAVRATNAAVNVLPKLYNFARRNAVFHANPTATKGLGPYASSYYFPALRYAH